jgi:hypothetical protein
MRKAVSLAFILLAACSGVSDSSWFTIKGIALPGKTDSTGTISLTLADSGAVLVDLHLRNSGTSPGTQKGTGIRGFTVTMDYRFPGTSFQLAGFTQTVSGYLPAPVDGEASTTVLGGIALLTADRVAILKGGPWGGGPFTMQVDFTVNGETDDGATVVTGGGITVTVLRESPSVTPTATPTPTVTPIPAPL